MLRGFRQDLASKALWSLGSLLVRGSKEHAFDLDCHSGTSAPAPGVPAPAARCARRFLSARPAAPPCAWAPRRQPRYRCLGCSSPPSARCRPEQASRPLSRLLLRPPSCRAKCRPSPSRRRSVGSWKVTPGSGPDLCPDLSPPGGLFSAGLKARMETPGH